jgi:hypothetical protein
MKQAVVVILLGVHFYLEDGSKIFFRQMTEPLQG